MINWPASETAVHKTNGTTHKVESKEILVQAMEVMMPEIIEMLKLAENTPSEGVYI